MNKHNNQQGQDASVNEKPHEDTVRGAIERAVEAIPELSIMPDHEFDQVLAAMQEASEVREAQDRAAGKRFLDEERDRDVIDGWYAEASKMKLAVLPTFLNGLATAYRHDYGTICHAIAAAALAAAHAIDNSETGGITGFQAGAIQWEFIRRWMQIDGPMRLVKFEDYLYPQYEQNFRTLSADTWEWLQREAASKLRDNPDAHPRVIAHWRSIVDGVVPFGFAVSP